MKPKSWIRNALTCPVTHPIRTKRSRFRLEVERLEDRLPPAIFTVLNSNDTGAGSLRNAVAQANANIGTDTIVFGDGSGTGGTNFLDLTPDVITLTSGPITFTGDTALTTVTGTGANLLTVSGGGTQRVFYIDPGMATSISGMTMTGGKANGALLTAASAGGAIYSAGTLDLDNVTVTGNTASGTGGGGFGGAVHSQGNMTLTNCLITGNIGSGLNTGNGSGNLAVSGSTFNVNSLKGIQLGGGNARITDSTISGNSSQGLNAYLTNLRMTNCTVTGNASPGNDGAGVTIGLGSAELVNCTITGNTTNVNGGGVLLRGTATFRNCTISGNSAAIGGGVNVFTGTPTFVNTIIAGNTATNRGPDVGGTSNNPQTITSLGNNLIGKTDGSTGWIGSDLTGTIASPLDPRLALLGNYGGTVQTLALLADSPAIDAGNSTAAPSEVQDVTVTGSAGTFTLTFDGQTTTPIIFNATAGTVQTALNALSSIGGVGGSVSVTQFGTVYRVTFGGSLANQNLTEMTALGSGGATATVFTVVNGNTDQRGFSRTVNGSVDIGAYEAVSVLVTNTSDVVNGNTASIAALLASPGADGISLREAIVAANNTPGGSESIGFASGTFSTPQTINISGGELVLDSVSPTLITGTGANRLTIDANKTSRVFLINSGKSASLTGLTITEGFGVFIGGGLRNDGTVTIDGVAFKNNSGDHGGGFGNMGSATVSNSTFSSNNAPNEGGGLENYGTMNVINSTFASNNSVRGGGIANAGGGTLTLTNVTISGNSASTSGGGIENIGGTVILRNSIVANASSGGSIAGTVSGSNNLIGMGGSGGLVDGVNFNQVGVSNVGLAALADNGGPTQTMALLPTSPALNAGDPLANATGVDQRGQTRFGNTDIGAYEYVFKVVNTSDTSNLGSLRAAMENANTSPGHDTIVFRIPGAGVKTIQPTYLSGGVSLPVITESVTIDGWSQGGSGYTGSPLIELDGTNAFGAVGSFGLNIRASNTIIRGLAINRYPNVSGNGFGIGVFNSASNVWIYGNYIGTNALGTAAAGNGQGGIWVGAGSTGVTIGTNADSVNDAAERNVISGNNGNGILMQGTSNTIAGNHIGTNAAGTGALANSNGILIGNGARNNVIGGTTLASRNLISGNTNAGILINGAGTSGNLVLGNVIGLAITGASKLANGSHGIIINNNASGNTIGGSVAGAGNVISGNSVNGVKLDASNFNVVAGNIVGLNLTGTVDLGNGQDGVAVGNGSSNNTIGGTVPAARNIISGNDAAGVIFRNAPTINNLVIGNYIGTDITGTLARENFEAGITITNANKVTIGGTTASERNVISGNRAGGIRIQSGATQNVAFGNYIGVAADGISPVGAGFTGVFLLSGSSGNTIGGIAPGAGNIIAYSSGDGVSFGDTNITDSTVRGNSIYSNGGLGIDVGDDGLTLNTPGRSQNAPVYTSVRTGVGVIEVEGFVRPGQTIDFYLSDSLGQGRQYLASATEGSPADTDATSGSYGPGPVSGNVVGSDTANRFHFTIPVPADFVVGTKVTAVAVGSVSEFAASLAGDVSKAFGAPVVDAGPDAVLVVGQTFTARGSFSDIDSDFWPSAEVNYGDGSGWQPLALDPPVYAPQSAEDFTIAATVGFALSHRYAAAGNYTVSVRVTDDSGATGGDALIVEMENAPPVIDNSHFVVTPQRLSEGGTVTLTGKFSDASPVDTHEVRIIWGDGTQSYATVNETNRTFSATHVYLDDNLLNTASDVYPLQAIITDGAGASGTTVSGLFFVQVDNVRPSALTLTTSSPTINEGGTFVIGGSFTDPGVQDTHRVAITWGDGSPDTLVMLPAGVTTFSGITHLYANNPASPATSYAVSVRVVDDDEPLTPITAAASVTVNNVVPSNVVVTPSLASINENDTMTLAGSFTDPGTLDAHTVVIDWGDGSGKKILNLAAGVTSFSGITHRYLDNPLGKPTGSFPITVTVADTDQPTTLATGVGTILVRNADPSLNFTLSQSTISENGTVVVTGSYADPGTLDRHTVSINWGDGSVTNATVDRTTRTFHASHRYSDDNPSGTMSDQYTIAATVTDNDSAIGSATRSLTVNNTAPIVRILPGTNNSLAGIQLVSTVTDASPSDTFTYAWAVTPVGGGATITGTGPTFTFASAPNTSYTATLTVTDDDLGVATTALRVDVLTEFADTYAPASAPTGVSGIVVFGLGGADTIDGSALAIPLILDGGADTDTLTGGSADDVIVLHQGNDKGFGLGGNDRFVLTPNSTLTVEDGFGNNTLDFGTSNFGITFDLTRTAGQLQDVHPATPLLHFVSVNDFGTGTFGTLAGSTYDDFLTAAPNSTLSGDRGRDTFFVNFTAGYTQISGGADADQLTTSGAGIANIDFRGDDGADTLTNLGTVATITFTGGSDGDQLQNSGSISLIDFRGDDGADTLTNLGTVATITFTGGSDGDLLQNSGTIATTIDFRGDDGADILTNSGTVATITFTGGSDGDLLQTSTGSTATLIDFRGDDGADTLTNLGGVATIIFTGGADGDLLQNSGTIATAIDFRGDDGADILTNSGTVATITFTGGSDGDLLQNGGTVATIIDFRGDDGADTLTNLGSVATIIFTGGSDGDLLQTSTSSSASVIDFRGDDGADTLLNNGTVATITFTGGSDGDLLQNGGTVATVIDFRGDDGADTLTNLGSVATITFTGGADGDLLQTSTSSSATVIDFRGDDGADTLTNLGSVGTITFTGGSDGDLLQNAGTIATKIDFRGDDGADTLLNNGSVATITFTGGSDGDLLQNGGTVATKIDFQGDDGADTLTNLGSVATITFTGGSDGDLLQTSTSSSATVIDFRGDDGADTLTNFGSVTTITFTGGSDADRLRNYASGANLLSFRGDDGADLLVNTGSNIATISFLGDDGADILLNTGSVTKIDFQGDDGADILQNDGTTATITFTGGSDADQLLNNGTGVTLIDFRGDDGADILTNYGAVTTITFTGGADGDLLQTSTSSSATVIDFRGDDGADTLTSFGTVATITFTGGSDGDLLQNAGTVATKIDFQGDDGADILQNIGTVATITFTGGSDGDLLQNAGTVATIIDFRGDDGADTLTNYGTVATITFTGGSDGDLLQTSTGSAATLIDFKGDDGADTLLNFGTTSTITFTGGSDGDYLQNNGTVATIIDFRGDDGADTLVNVNASVATITFTGGSDGDTFWNSGIGLGSVTFLGDDGADTLVNDGTVATRIDFRGDDGADLLTNNGKVATITFTGGSDGDLLQNTGTVTTKIDFQGDDGADTLTNLGSVATITFKGGSDADILQTAAGSAATVIDFRGDDGADNLLNTGTVGTITFVGGSDGDLLQNGGTVATKIDFQGDDGADTLINSGSAAIITFTAGADDDLYIERGGMAQITYNAGGGNDRILFSGNSTATFNGGPGSDEFVFVGAAKGAIAIQDDDSPLDTNSLNFAGYTAGGVTLDLSQTTAQTVASGLALTLSSAASISNVVGTSFADSLIGNDRNNVLTGAALSDDRVQPGPQWDGVTQWVYLDFDTETENGERVYTATERDAIQARIAADFQGPDPQNPWFHVRFTQNRNDIPTVLLDAEQYATLYFNRTPNSNRPGGEASELDFRNTNLGGTASIQVNGLTGGANQPATTSENVVALAAKIGAHELAHLMGVRHADSFGPIGYGLHSPPGTGSFKPAINGPVGAYETYNHLIGSPATIGTDRFNDLNNLYFGEREAIKLSFTERGTVAAEQTGTHGTIATAQPLTLASLTVPTTSQGLNAGSSFQVAALAVTGQISLAGAKSESDFYSFAGRKGDLISIEVISTGLANPGETIDSVVRLYDSAGNLVSYYGGLAVNDDQFEPTDSLLYDVLLPADGTYFIEVDTFARSASDPIYDPQNPTSPLNPENIGSIINPLNPNFDPELREAFLDIRDDTDTGRYELFLYRFGASNAADSGDSIQGGAGDDTILGGMGGDALQGGPGDDVIGLDGIGTAVSAPVNSTANESATVVVMTVSGGQSVNWRIAASNGQVIADGQGTTISFVPTDNGTYTVNYTVYGSLGDSWSDSTVVTVLNVAPTATLSNGGAVDEGSTGSVSFGSPSDTALDLTDLRYAFDFDNDGMFDLGNGTHAGSQSSPNATVPASYLNNGPLNRIVKGRIIDKDGGYTDYTTTIAVNNVAPTLTVGGTAILTSPTLSRSGSFSDPGADTWTATVDYGDGSGSQPLTLNADKTFTLNHTYTAVGIFTVTVTVDDGTVTSTATFQVIHNIPATIDARPDLTADEGALVSLAGTTFENPYVSGLHTATINWGDGTAVVAGGVSQTPVGSGVTGTISGTHRYADNGTYIVTVTVTTPYGAVSSDTFSVTVNNVAPTLAIPTGPTMVIPGQPLAYSGTFSDPGFNNSLNVGGEIVETFTGTVNWGDGSATETAAVTWVTGSSGVASTGLAALAHTYATTGHYTITLTIHDDDSGSATQTLAVNVTESVFVLATTGSEVLTVTGNGKVVMPGVIEVNSNSPTAIKASGNGQIQASQIHVVGGYSLSGNATISPTPTTGGTAAADPLAGLTAPSLSGTIGSVNLSGNATLTIGPGRYSQIKVSGNASLTMLPGVYVILGGGVSITGNANVAGNGVMIYNAGNSGTFGGIAVTGNGTINLSPPAVGQPYAGILFFQARDNTRALAISGNGLLGLRGTIYAPAAQLALSGHAELRAALVVRSASVSGNASSTLMNQGDVGVADLAETLLGADLWIYVDNADGAFTPAALSRIDSTIAGMNALLGAHNVFISQVASIHDANVVLDVDPTTPLGGMSQGVLGYFAESGGRGLITLVQGWNWYAGEDPAGVGTAQFDFQTIVTHELGHALGLGHNDNTSSVMHDELSSGAVRRTITEEDLNIPESGGEGDPLIAAGWHYPVLEPETPETTVPAVAGTPRTARILNWYLAPTVDSGISHAPAFEVLGFATALPKLERDNNQIPFATGLEEEDLLERRGEFETLLDRYGVRGTGDVWANADRAIPGDEFDPFNGAWVG